MGVLETAKRRLVRGVAHELMFDVRYDHVDKQWSGRVSKGIMERGCDLNRLVISHGRDKEMDQLVAELYVADALLTEAGDGAGQKIADVLFGSVADDVRLRAHSGTYHNKYSPKHEIFEEAHLKLWWDELRNSVGVKMRFSRVLG
jgi:hypothetical protein